MLDIEERRKAIDSLTENYTKVIDALIAVKSGGDEYAGDYAVITESFQKAVEAFITD